MPKMNRDPKGGQGTSYYAPPDTYNAVISKVEFGSAKGDGPLQGNDQVKLWLDRRHQLHVNGRRRVFCTLKGGPVSATYVRMMLTRLADKAGIEKRVHPHGLRHTHAAELCSEGTPVNVISRQLGHSNAATTARYIDHILPVQVIKTMQARTWPGG